MIASNGGSMALRATSPTYCITASTASSGMLVTQPFLQDTPRTSTPPPVLANAASVSANLSRLGSLIRVPAQDTFMNF